MSFIIQPPRTREERRWLRNDAHLWLRPDHARFEKPQRFERKYSPNQPRVPAGDPGGGQWTSGGAPTAPASQFDIQADGLSLFENVGGADGPSDQLAFLGQAFQLGRFALQRGAEAALALFAALSGGNGPDGNAVAVFRAADFEPGADPQSAVSAVGRLTRDEVDQACPAHELVQNMTDRAAAAFNRVDYTASGYGTAVHTKLRDDVEALSDLRLRAEVSLFKTLQETGSLPPGESQRADYGQRGSVRIDILEKAATYTVCVYDIKTGASIFGPSRMRELAQTVLFRFPDTLRIVVTEVRPGR